MKVFVFDPLWSGLLTPENEARLKSAGAEIILTTKEGALIDKKELYEESGDKILAVNPDYVGWSLPAEKFVDIPGLKAIITASTSFGWINVEAATQKGIAVINIRNFSTDAVADWAIMMALNLARRVPLLIKNNFPLNFGSDFETYQGMNLKGKKAGIIGLGNIGMAIAERCHGLGMEVCYWNRSPKQSAYKSVDLMTLFKSCDVIFPSMADNEETHKIITDEMIESMKPSVIFASIVKGYYNRDLLLARAAKGALFGYGFEAEAGSFVNYQGNVWAVPAYAWCTDGSLRASMDCFVEAIAHAAKGDYPNQVS